MTKTDEFSADEKAQIAKSELVDAAIKLGTPSYEAWQLSTEQLSALLPNDEE